MNERIEITPHTAVDVRVTAAGGVRWQGREYAVGEIFTAKHYQIEPAIKAGQVVLVAAVPGLNLEPARPQVQEIAPPAEPPAKG